MEWLPEKDMWLTYLKVQATAGQLTHDLAIDATGENRPSPVAAGLRLPDVYIPSQAPSALVWLIAAALGAGAVLVTNRVVDAR